MNKILNDLGELVIASGSPGSQARVGCEYPRLIKDVRQLIEWANEDRSEIQSPESILATYLSVNEIDLSELEIRSVISELEAQDGGAA